MSSFSTPDSSRSSTQIPLWIQISVGLVLVSLIGLATLLPSPFLSVWHPRDSSAYNNSLDALHQRGVYPSGTTFVIFWEMGCEMCMENIEKLKLLPAHVRVIGIHVTTERHLHREIELVWAKFGPSSYQHLIDEQDLLKTGFGVRGTPSQFILIPKEQKTFQHFGRLESTLKETLKLL